MNPDFNQAFEFYEKVAILGDRDGKKLKKIFFIYFLKIKIFLFFFDFRKK